MEFDIAVNGNLVLPSDVVQDGWLAVRDGKIAGVFGPGQRPAAGRVIDARGKFVLPGAIDAHVHAFSNSTHVEGFGGLTRAAAAGGVTTVIDMPYDSPEPVTTAELFRKKAEKIQRDAVVDVALYGTVAKHGGWEQVEPLAAAGACAFKMSTYETDPRRFPEIPDGELIQAFREIRGTGRVAAFHAENGAIIDPLIQRLRPEGRVNPEAHCASRPPEAESTAVAKLLELARAHPVRLHIAHLTVPFAFDLIQWYRARGVDVTAETCIQYLVLVQSDLSRLKAFAKCNPPLRTEAVREQLWEKLLAGQIDFVTSDHAPWPLEAKQHENIFDNASGFPGVQTLLPLLFSEGVVRRGMDVRLLARLLAANPARRFGLYPRKGALLPGADADFTVVDPGARWTFSAAEAFSVAKWSPYDGMELQGRVDLTVVRGEPVFENGAIVREAGHGRFVAPQTPGGER